MKRLLLILTILSAAILMQAQESYKRPEGYGGLKMDTPASTLIVTPATFVQLLGTFDDACDCKDFSADASGNLTYIGMGGRYVFVGTSDVSADKVCEIQYALFVNDVQDGTTEHDFDAANKSENISITWFIDLVYGDVLNVRATADVSNTTITPSSLNMTFDYVFKH